MALSSQIPDEQKDQVLDWLENQVLNHPEYGKDIKRTLKKIEPRVNFPEIDLEERFDAKTKEQEEKLQKFLDTQRDKENKEYWEKKRSWAKSEGLISDEDQPEFEKWMIDEKLGNYERAAKMWHDEKVKAAEPTNYSDVAGIQLPNEPGLFQNPIQWARNEGLKEIKALRRSS